MTNGIGLATPGDTQHVQINITPSAVTGTDALRALERLYGTAGLEQAITAWQFDTDVRSRLNYLHQAEDDADTRASFDLMRRRGLAGVADELQANWMASTPRPVAEPLPPLAAAVHQ